MASTVRAIALVLVAFALVSAASPPTIGGFRLTLPVTAGLPDATGATDPTLPLVVEGTVAFPAVAPGGPASKSELTLRNEAAVALRVKAEATPLAGPDGTSIPAQYLTIKAPSTHGLLVGVVDVGVIQPGETMRVDVILTPPHGDVQYLPEGPYRGTITITAEVAS